MNPAAWLALCDFRLRTDHPATYTNHQDGSCTVPLGHLPPCRFGTEHEARCWAEYTASRLRRGLGPDPACEDPMLAPLPGHFLRRHPPTP
jgi:hypothetical protein